MATPWGWPRNVFSDRLTRLPCQEADSGVESRAWASGWGRAPVPEAGSLSAKGDRYLGVSRLIQQAWEKLLSGKSDVFFSALIFNAIRAFSRISTKRAGRGAKG
ncbi:MAG: hypothetical protein LWW84_08125 [Azovibrio sp.]|nr:hypothetical protein [Azovibrio sp.]